MGRGAGQAAADPGAHPLAVYAVAVDEPVQIGRLVRPEPGQHLLLVKIVDAREKGQKQIGFFREIVIKGTGGYAKTGADAPHGQVFIAHLIDHGVDLFQQFLAAGVLFDRCSHGARPPVLVWNTYTGRLSANYEPIIEQYAQKNKCFVEIN